MARINTPMSGLQMTSYGQLTHHHRILNKSTLQFKQGKVLRSRKFSNPLNNNIFHRYRTMELKKNLEEFDSSNYFDEENIFDSLNFYSTHIHNIKEFCGVGEIKSLRTIKEIIKVVRLNLKKKRKQESTDQLDSDVASLDDLQKSFVEVSSTFKLPEICSKPMNSLREEEINTNSVEKTVPIVPEGKFANYITKTIIT